MVVVVLFLFLMSLSTVVSAIKQRRHLSKVSLVVLVITSVMLINYMINPPQWPIRSESLNGRL